jgi:cell division protein FtsB
VISTILEGVLALLLIACLYYCWRLDQKLSRLRQGQDGVRAAAAELAQSVVQAEAAIRTLRATAKEAGQELQDCINDARRLAERIGRAGGGR